MSYNFILVHSPLIGTYSWKLVANQLERAGHPTVIPSLLPVLSRTTSYAAGIAQIAADAVEKTGLSGPLVLAGHSAAGAYLPVIASSIDREIMAYIFVDARLPRPGVSLSDEDSPEEKDALQALASAGWLPPWSEWFGEEAMRSVLPEGVIRDEFRAELQPIPLALFSEKITFSSSWLDAPCGYIRLSEYYRETARKAMLKGWPVREIDAGHLHLLTHPESVTALLLDMVRNLE